MLALYHLLNFVMPALAVALLLVTGCHLFQRKRAKAYGWWRPVAMLFAVGCAVLLAGLWFFGNDGKILTYGALVVACATSQWLWMRSWRD